MTRRHQLTTFDMYRLHRACKAIRTVWNHVYLVGSALEKPDFRDVDVRVMLSDDDFYAAFPVTEAWELACMVYTAWLRDETGLPIDFQFQRTEVANAKYPGRPRNALGLGAVQYAGGGDAT